MGLMRLASLIGSFDRIGPWINSNLRLMRLTSPTESCGRTKSRFQFTSEGELQKSLKGPPSPKVNPNQGEFDVSVNKWNLN